MRNYGRFTTTIFRDEDFQALTLSQQGVYFMLGLQPDVTAAGTLPLTLRRWANMAAGLSPDDLRKEIDVLAEHGHVLVDDDSEELLIVKFIKWDGGVNNEKRRPVIREAALGIASRVIRHRVAHEIANLGFPDMASGLWITSPSDTASDTQSGFDRVVETIGDHIPQPLSPTLKGEGPQTASPIGASAEPPAMFCKKHPNGADGNCGGCADARRLHTAWQLEQAERERADLRAARKARETCPDCHGAVWLDDGTKCEHPNSRRTA